MIRRYRKKMLEVEAVQWTGHNQDECERFVDRPVIQNSGYRLVFPTLEGDMSAELYDYIVKGGAGELYIYKPGPFEAVYEGMKE